MVYNFKKSLILWGHGDKIRKKRIAKMGKTCYNTACVRRMGALEIGMSPSGKASDFDSDIRRFESGHPSQISYGSLAQLVEQRPFKAWVQGSSP